MSVSQVAIPSDAELRAGALGLFSRLPRGSVRFNATADILTRTSNNPSMSLFTLMGWIYITADTNSFPTPLKIGVVSGGNYMALQFDQTSANTTLDLWDGNLDNYGSNVALNTWYHVAMTYNGATLRAYAGGALDRTATSSPQPGGHIAIGGDTSAAGRFDGRITNVRIWSAELTADEIQREMRSPVPVRWKNINGWYPMTHHSNARIDFSGSKNHMTQAGTLTTEPGPYIPLRELRRKRSFFVSGAGGSLFAIGSSAGVSVLSSSAGARRGASASFSGVGAIAGASRVNRPLASSISAASTVAGDGKTFARIVASIAALSGVSATSKRLSKLLSSIAGASTVAATGKNAARASATVAGLSVVNGASRGTRPAVGSIAGLGSTSAAGSALRRATATIAGASGQAATLKMLRRVTSSITGVSFVAGAGGRHIPTSGAIAGTSAFSATFEQLTRIIGAIAGLGALSAGAKLKRNISSAIAGIGAASASPKAKYGAVSAVAGIGAVAGTGGVRRGAMAAVAAVSSVSATVARRMAAQVAIAAAAVLSASAAFGGSFHAAVGEIVALGVLSAVGQARLEANSTIFGAHGQASLLGRLGIVLLATGSSDSVSFLKAAWLNNSVVGLISGAVVTRFMSAVATLFSGPGASTVTSVRGVDANVQENP